MIMFNGGGSCRGSWPVLVAACLVALLVIGLALVGDRLFGEGFKEWAPLVVASVGGSFVIACGGTCCRAGRKRDRAEPGPDLSDWPSA